MEQKKGRKAAAKKAAPKAKVKTEIRYIPIDSPMPAVELRSAFNVSQTDPLRRAVNQVLTEEIQAANSKLQPPVDDLRYWVGFEKGLQFALQRLTEEYSSAMIKLDDDAMGEKTTIKGY